MLSLTSAAYAQEVPTATEEDSSSFALPTLVINGQETANLLPVSTYESPISNLQFNPRVDMQARNMAEAQGDVSIRGGIFENTGFQVGAATVIDPQTGHYSAELPIAPEMLGNPQVLTGADNALYGFNSSVGTIKYDWSQIQDGGSATIGGGDHDLNFQRIHQALTGGFTNTADWSWGVEAEFSRSESDGTIQHGDHNFNRTTGRVQLVGPNSQTDFFAGYQEKFFGWPAMYTPNPANHETENLKTRLFSINHQQNYGTDSNWELSTYYRRHSDYYVYKRESPNIYNATHETKSGALAFTGKHEINEAFALNHAAQFTADNIDSTSLENNFTSRSYYKFTLLPEYRMELADNEKLTFRAGATYDDTNRDSSKVSPISDITWARTHANGQSEKVYLSYAQATQVAGYTAIGGGTSGLFASNPNLDREISKNLELGFAIDRTEWSFQSAIFYRWDDDLVDWTYESTTPNARSANAVDIETFGIELIATRRWGNIEGIASYAYLHKNEDYGSNDDIDASFYALNFPEHRATLGAIWRPIEMLEFRIDNEWRSQEENDLRNGSDNAFFTTLGLSIFPPQVDGLELFASVDNAWDDDFEEVPGTPGRGDQVSVGATYRW